MVLLCREKYISLRSGNLRILASMPRNTMMRGISLWSVGDQFVISLTLNPFVHMMECIGDPFKVWMKLVWKYMVSSTKSESVSNVVKENKCKMGWVLENPDGWFKKLFGFNQTMRRILTLWTRLIFYQAYRRSTVSAYLTLYQLGCYIQRVQDIPSQILLD